MNTRSRIRLVEALTLFVCFAFFGCGSSGGGGAGGSDRTTGTNNLTASGLSVVSPEPRVGYPLEVNTFIEAEDLAENVSVSYYALNKSDVDQELDEIRQFFLATVTFPTVQPSVTEYLAEFTVPPEVDPPGEYVLQYVVDPGNTVAEPDDDLDENDNSNSGDVFLAPMGDLNLFIEEFTLDSPVLVLYNDPVNKDKTDDDVERDGLEQDGQVVEDVHDSDAGATLVVGLEGALEPLDAKVYVYLRITRGDLPLGQNTHDVPMYLWDSVAGRYVQAYGTPPDKKGPPEGLLIGTLSPQMVTGAEGSESELYLPPDGGVEMVTGAEDTDDLHTSDRTSVHLDIYYPGGLAKEMWEIVEDLQFFEPQTLSTYSTGGKPRGDQTPPDLTPAAIRDLEDFFEGATKELVDGNESCCTDMSFSIVAKVLCGGLRQVVEDSLDDNERSELVELVLMGPGFNPPLPHEPIEGVGEGTETGFDGKNFGVHFSFDSGASLNEEGAKAFVEGSVPVRIFDFLEFDFMRLDARAQVVPAEDPEPPEDETSGFFLHFYFFDQEVMLERGALGQVRGIDVPPFTVPVNELLGYTYPPDDPKCDGDDKDMDGIPNDYDDPENPDLDCYQEETDANPLPTHCNNKIDDWEDACPDEPGCFHDDYCPVPDEAPAGSCCGADRNGCPDPRNPGPPTGCPATNPFSITKEVKYDQLFFVGPVPFTASASVAGEIGFKLYANIQPFGLASKTGPFAKLEATITGAVGIPILKAGFGGTLTFIDEEFQASVTTGLALSFNDGFPIGFEGQFSMSVINTLTGPQGELFLFADYPVVKWCAVLGRSFPCGLPTIRNKLVLAKFESFVKEDVLFDKRLCKRRTFAKPLADPRVEGSWGKCDE